MSTISPDGGGLPTGQEAERLKSMRDLEKENAKLRKEIGYLKIINDVIAISVLARYSYGNKEQARNYGNNDSSSIYPYR